MNPLKRRVVFSMPLLLLASLPTPAALAAPPDAAKAATLPLAVTAEKGLTVTAPGEATWDFGKRAIQTGEVIVHTFTLRNSGTTPLRIDSLLTSCHCTEATLILPPVKGGAAHTEEGFMLAPGKSVGVRVAIDTALAHAVDFRKMVWGYVKGRDEAVLTLTLAGTLTQATSAN